MSSLEVPAVSGAGFLAAGFRAIDSHPLSFLSTTTEHRHAMVSACSRPRRFPAHASTSRAGLPPRSRRERDHIRLVRGPDRRYQPPGIETIRADFEARKNRVVPMRITAIHDIVVPISSSIRNAYIDFST